MNRSLNNSFIRKLQQGAANRWRINSPFVSRTKLLGRREVMRHFYQQRVDTGYTNPPPLPRFVSQSLAALNIHKTLQEQTDEDYNIVHVVSADHVNSGKKFVAKAFLRDEHGNNELFENELDVYEELMSRSKNAELWPKLIEYGMLNIQGCAYYYLATELLDGEEASQKECEECALLLQNVYGLVHNDVNPSNFIRLPTDSEGKRVVKALDFENSYFAPVSAKEPPRLVGRTLKEFQVHAELQKETDEHYTFVYLVSADHVNSGKKFIVKAFLPEEKGSNAFYENELSVYRELMSRSNNAELWPKLIEHGNLIAHGDLYYYLGIELLEGEQATQKECEGCALSLQKLYGLVHNDVSPSNFIRLAADSEGKKVVKALDFEHSYFTPVSTKDVPSGQSKSANTSIGSGLVGFCSATILFMVARLFDLF